MFSEGEATDDGKPLAEHPAQPPEMRDFMRSNTDNNAASNPSNSGSKHQVLSLHAFVYIRSRYVYTILACVIDVCSNGYLVLLLHRTKCYIETCGNSFF